MEREKKKKRSPPILTLDLSTLSRALRKQKKTKNSRPLSPSSDPLLVSLLDGTLIAVEPTTGTPLWAFDSGSPLVSSGGLGGGRGSRGGGGRQQDGDGDGDGDGGGDDDAGGKGRPSPSRTSSYDPFFSRFYAWDQTRGHVIVAVRLPTGDADRGLRVEVAETAVASGDGDEGGFSPPSSPSSPSSRPTHRLLVAADGAPPVIDRVLSRAVARGGASSSPSDPLRHSPPVLVRRSADKRALLLTVAKAVPGELWPCLFLGDSLGARCVDPPYAVREGSGSGSGRSSRGSGENNDDDDDDENSSPSAAADGAVVEVELCPRLLPLPAWVEKRHISVETTVEKLSVRVEGLFELERYFW